MKPDTNEGKPPPPPAPPAPPAEPKQAAPVKKEREKDQWKQVRNDKGRKYWYNEKVGGVPDDERAQSARMDLPGGFPLRAMYLGQTIYVQ